MERLSVWTQGRWIPLVTFLSLLVVYHYIFGQFFPANNGMIGNDYSLTFPELLDGYFWLKSNGFFVPFWFTPAFCGGQPVLGYPQSEFYSIAQLLTIFFNPLSSVYATVILFASIGFFGTYILLRKCFGSSHQSAVLGGALFMFNGFFIHRMIVGHFEFHSVMLIPLIAWLLIKEIKKSKFGTLIYGTAAGCLLAYCIYSGSLNLLIPIAMVILAILCLHRLNGHKSSGVLQRSMVSVLVAVSLSAAKLVATFSFLQNFPRSDYYLPGINGVWNAIALLFNTLFLSPTNIADQTQPLFANLQWLLERHEWEYGVTIVPLLIIAMSIVIKLCRGHINLPSLSMASFLWSAILVGILIVPIALNIYTPGWNDFLKQVPIIKSSSTLIRWLLIYIPIVILLSALAFDKISLLSSRRNGMLIVALSVLILDNAVKDRNFYHSQLYSPSPIINAWKVVHDGTTSPNIKYIGAYLDDYNMIQTPINRNDMIAFGGSQISCYNPIFGYDLEHFPRKELHLGPVLEERNGLLNIKNPACYTYSENNNCSPGDHFSVTQLDAAKAFTNYEPYPFLFSAKQKVANWLTLFTLSLVMLSFCVVLLRTCTRKYGRRGEKTESTPEIHHPH